MEGEGRLVAYGNTYNPCLLILREKGYRLAAEEGRDAMVYLAHKAGMTFVGGSPPELLGLVTLWEHSGPAWDRREPAVLDEILGATCED